MTLPCIPARRAGTSVCRRFELLGAGGVCLLLLACMLPTAGLEGADDSVASLPLAQLNQLFANKDYSGLETLCRQLRVDHPTNSEVDYELACALARLNKPAEAVTNLSLACDHGFSDSARAMSDDDLASLRDRPDFTKVIKAMSSKPIGASAAYEAGAEMPGLKSIEKQPTGGLRYRLRLATDATVEKPARLVVWLHPSGGSANTLVEALAPELAKHHFALAVFTQKQFLYWSDQEIAALRPTISDLESVPGIDGKPPVLMGFSAGGQAAIKLWEATPTAFAALLLNSAYPLDIDGSQHATLITPTAAELAAKTPMLAIIGADDRNIQTWTSVIPTWTTQGLPVELITVPGAHHQYLFSGDAWIKTMAYLDHLDLGSKK